MPTLVPPVVPAGSLRGREQPTLRAGGGLVLRPWRDGDVEAVRAAFADPAIRRWHLRSLDSAEEARAWIEQWPRAWRAETDGCWAVAWERGEVAGRVALRDISLAAGFAQCSYWVLPGARGGGVATRAVVGVTGWALGEAGLHRIELLHSAVNEPSCRVATKAGFRLEGVLRSAMLHADGWHDMHLHGRVRGDEKT